MSINKNIQYFIRISVLYCICFSSIFSYNFYRENQNLYNLFEYRNHSSPSKFYYRNLIAFYYFDEQKKTDLLEFLKIQEPSFYWTAKILWEEENKGIYNPIVAIWNQYVAISRSIDYVSLKKHCNFFGEYFCQWIEDVEFIYENYYQTKRNLGIRELEVILLRLKPYLLKNEFIPFMYRTASWLPSFLIEIGFVIESSIIIRAMINRESKENQDLLRKELVKSLVFSGNFEYAFKVIREFQIEIEEKYFNSFNILMLSFNYDLMIQNLEENFIKRNFSNQNDIWTHFPISKHLVKTRILEILYVKNQNLNVFTQLENLLKEQEFSEFEKLYLRLIQSKILYDSNIQLAQKIAEDVQFKAQEKDFYLLEYYATIWNAWCLYKQGQYYPSSIEFTKALNIANKHFPKISKYSVLLGLLLTKKKFNITDLNLINELSISMRNLIPKQEYFYFIGWTPMDIPFDSWKDIYVEFLYTKKNYKFLFDYIISEYRKNYFFENSKNPGGFVGIFTTSLWKNQFQEESKNFDFPVKNYSYTNFVNKKKESIFFIKTSTNIYSIMFSKNLVFLYKHKITSNYSRDLMNLINSYFSPKLEVILNPEVELSLQELLNSLDLSKIQLSLIYLQSFTKKFDSIGLSDVQENKNTLCDLNRIFHQDFVLLPKSYISYKDYPFLIKFQCSENDFYRLWDLERFLPTNKKILLPFFLEIPEWNAFLLVAVRKNWYIEIISPTLIKFKNFEE